MSQTYSYSIAGKENPHGLFCTFLYFLLLRLALIYTKFNSRICRFSHWLPLSLFPDFYNITRPSRWGRSWWNCRWPKLCILHLWYACQDTHRGHISNNCHLFRCKVYVKRRNSCSHNRQQQFSVFLSVTYGLQIFNRENFKKQTRVEVEQLWLDLFLFISLRTICLLQKKRPLSKSWPSHKGRFERKCSR